MERNPSTEGNRSRNPSHFMEPRTSLKVPILSQIDAVHAPSHFSKIHFNIIPEVFVNGTVRIGTDGANGDGINVIFRTKRSALVY